MAHVDNILIAKHLLLINPTDGIAQRYLSIRRREHIIRNLVGGSARCIEQRLSHRLNRILVLRRHLEPLLMQAAFEQSEARFVATVPTEALGHALAKRGDRRRGVVLSFNGSSLALDGIPVPTAAGRGRGLAMVRTRDVQSACRLADVIAVSVELGTWQVIPDSACDKLQFRQIGL